MRALTALKNNGYFAIKLAIIQNLDTTKYQWTYFFPPAIIDIKEGFFLNIAICDDEPVFVDFFSKIVNGYFEENGLSCSIFKFYDAKNLVSECCSPDNKIDVAVLDIEMPDYNGIDAAKDIRKFNNDMTLMFLSSNNSHGDSACDLKIYKYIYKIAGKEKIYAAFDALIAEQKYNELSYEIHNDGKILNVLVKDIIYVQVRDHYAYFHLTDRILCERNSIKDIVNNSKFERFIRILRNTIVNFGYIDTIKDKVILKNGEKLNYSDRKYHDILNKYLYLRPANKSQAPRE